MEGGGEDVLLLLIGAEGVVLRLLQSLSGFTGVFFVLELALLAFTFGFSAVLSHPGYIALIHPLVIA